jgi:hypothetical protein
MATTGAIKVAIAADFLKAFAKIPKKLQGKVLEFVTKFRTNPMASSINYEKISSFKDSTLRSVRIDQNYRGIVKKPETGNVFMLLWVDNHDKAYQWAENKKCTINPETGSLQIYEVDEKKVYENVSDSWQNEDQSKCIFEEVRDKHLIKFGIPKELIPMVRNICTESQLDKVIEYLPSEAGEVLLALGAGYTIEEVYNEFDLSAKDSKPVDIEDYEKALDNPDTKRRFFVAEDDLVLQEILEAPLEKWRVFLHPSQRNLVEKEWNGPVRVLGGAGTGKTVVAMHRAKWLVENVFTKESDKIIFTTFTRNLAADIRENLSKICSEKQMRKIEVINLDSWVSGFLRKNGYSYEIDYGSRSKPLWEKAISLVPDELSLDETFYREEWERVIQPGSVISFAEYSKISRIGRGVRLNRKERKLIWPVFEEYRLLLNENRLREVEDAMRDASVLIGEKGDILPYKAVVVDEAQDMSMQAFRLIKSMIPDDQQKNSIFIVGDAHQRIYRHKVVLGQCAINIIGRGKKLRINYRTTEENRCWAVNLLKGINIDDLDGGLDDQKGYKSLLHGNMPRIEHLSSFQNEVEFIYDYIKQAENEGDTVNEICLVARTHSLLKQYSGALEEKGVESYSIKRSEAEDRRKKGVRLATMHRVKGLEFDRVIIAGVNDGIVPFEGNWEQSSDQIVVRETETNERALLYVAATRAKKEVIVTSFGKASRFICKE